MKSHDNVIIGNAKDNHSVSISHCGEQQFANLANPDHRAGGDGVFTPFFTADGEL
jgi:hypothetical protein